MRIHRIAGLVVVALGLSACGGGGSDEAAGQDGEVAGSITVLTQRTDIVDTVFADYEERFEQEYPEVDVSFEAITDYEGEVRIRMNTDDYGDVLPIPNSITADELPTFFDPLGSVEELSETYRFVTEQSYDGQGYGLAITGNAQGFVYNKAVWEQAGVTELPTTPEQFLEDLTAIGETTDAVPLYTNYAAGWPLTQWEGLRGALTADPAAVNSLAETDAPWGEGEEHGVFDGLLFDAVAAGVTEDDPTTTDWEQSKGLLGSGQIATMMLGSWSIVQMQEAAENPDDIGYMPFPNQVDGSFYSVIAGDYKNGINVNSENKAAARAWVDWFADESGYAVDQGGISPLIDDELPATLADFEAAGVQYIELDPAPAGDEGLVQAIDTGGEIGLFEPTYRQRLVDAARGASGETKEEIFEDLNTRWADARAQAVGG